MEYFTYEELKDIKKKVIAQHCSQKEAAEFRGLSKWNQAEELQKVFKYSVDEKTDQGEAFKVKTVFQMQFCLKSHIIVCNFSYLKCVQ